MEFYVVLYMCIHHQPKLSLHMGTCNVICAQVKTVHLSMRTPCAHTAGYFHGVKPRNIALAWIREHCKSTKNKPPECVEGVVYFMDGDNKYDLRLFEEVSCI